MNIKLARMEIPVLVELILKMYCVPRFGEICVVYFKFNNKQIKQYSTLVYTKRMIQFYGLI